MGVQAYAGSCQCGAVRYQVDTDLDSTITCNCSRCGRLGSILAFAPKDSFHLLSGEGDLKEYVFYKHVIHHKFCSTCGIQTFAEAPGPDGRQVVAVNVRCLEDVDPDSLNPTKVDGRSL